MKFLIAGLNHQDANQLQPNATLPLFTIHSLFPMNCNQMIIDASMGLVFFVVVVTITVVIIVCIAIVRIIHYLWTQ